MVTRTAPGTTVPVKFVRARKQMTLNVTIEEFDAERQLAAEQSEAEPAPVTPTDTGLDMSIGAITPDVARQLEVPSGRGGAVVRNIDPTGVAARGGLRPRDVILSINDTPTTSVAQVNEAIERVASGRLIRLLVWRDAGERLVQIRKP
jgi:serine protease Do